MVDNHDLGVASTTGPHASHATPPEAKSTGGDSAQTAQSSEGDPISTGDIDPDAQGREISMSHLSLSPPSMFSPGDSRDI